MDQEIEKQKDSTVQNTNEKERARWELLTIKWFEIALDWNFFKYGKEGKLLK